MAMHALNRMTGAIGKGLLVLGLVVLAGCQTTSEPRSAAQQVQLPGVTPGSASTAARKAGTHRADPSGFADEPHTLWARIRAGFMLDPAVIDNPRIDQQRLIFAGQPRYFEFSSDRSRRYMHYVVEQLDARQLPLELALLPFVESSYNPMAYSKSHAAGLWQFIPSTGQVYSLRQDWWYDGRRDVTASTQAALDYLTRLNEMFDGDWLLALAAYNCGEGCVGRAIKRNASLGLPTDYWNLQLPAETMKYVPKLLAMAQLIDSPAAYGMHLPDILDEPYFVEITVETQLDLHKAAKLAEISTEELLHLNPAFKRRVTAPQGAYQLLVPVATAEQFNAVLAQLPVEDHQAYQRYNVRRGDTLSTIAKRYQVPVTVIRDTNDIDGNLIRVGQTLMLPHSDMEIPKPGTLETVAAAQLTYQVKPGDNLWEIARRHGLSVGSLKRHNGLDSSALKVGQQLSLPGTKLAAASHNGQPGRKVTYTVRSGDSLYSIARKHRVAIENIREWNRVEKTLQPGQQLILHVL